MRFAQLRREGGARVSTNVMLRDLHIPPPHSSIGRRLEVVVEGLCLFGGCQLPLDATSPRSTEMEHTQDEDGRGGWSCVEGGKKKQRSHLP